MKDWLTEFAETTTDVMDEITPSFIFKYAAAGVILAGIIILIIKLLR